MRRAILTVIVYALILPAAVSYSQMMDHMKGHMGGMEKPMEGEGMKAAAKNSDALTQEASAGGVTVKVTYKNPGENSPVFDVVLDTHSVDLDQYMPDEIFRLRDDAGRVYNADVASVSGSGHHREVTVGFKGADISSAKSVEVLIDGVAGVDERAFRFEIEKGR
ncbi:MAG: hypothetical protein HY890_05805 [Deltaproteobacteria bacterium]|nr:hypothetical protein [Deltaproteobacteria bacterium]